MTVGELIDYLMTKDKSLEVGRVGHFGELYPMDAYNFSVSTAWRENGERYKVLNVETPDIGPFPE